MNEHRGRSEGPELALSVVIPTRNRSTTLRTTLERLTLSTLQRPWEVVVVANACTDDTPSMVKELMASGDLQIRLLEEPRPSGSIARNRGAHAAFAPLLVFLDDDILLEPDELAAMLAWYEGSDRRSLLVGQVLPLPEHLATPFGAFRQQSLGDVSRDSPPEDVDWYASGLAAVPAAVFSEVGGYAENYPGVGLEDADFAIRTRRAGHRIIFVPSVVGVHNDWAGSTARDYCRRAAAFSATAPLLTGAFPDNDHPWRPMIEVNRPPSLAEPRPERLRKQLKLAAVALAADRWLPVLADRVSLPPRPRAMIFRASVSLALFAGYQRGLRRLNAGSITNHGSGHDRPRTVPTRQPWFHRAAWRLSESELRGKTHLAGILRGRAAEVTGLVRLPNGQVLYHDPADYVSHHIYQGGYERAERWLSQLLIRPGAIVVDVGANIGLYTLTASQLVGPRGRVFAVEPGPALPALRAGIDATGCKNVTLVPFAVGAQEGEAVLHVPAHQAGLASMRASCQKVDPHVVGVRRLDALDGVPAGEIDLLKIDTEGYEAEVLAGASRWLEEQRVRAILVEVTPQFGAIDFVSRTTRGYGFEIFKIEYRKGVRYRPLLRPVSALEVENEPNQANYLFLRSDLVGQATFAP